MRAKADRSSGSARHRLIDAFNHVFMTRRTSRPRVAEVAEHAGVARSTFYDHYACVDDLHMTALARPLAALADAVAGRGNPVAVQRLLEHFWDNRDRARQTLGGDTRTKVERLLAGMVLERLARPEAHADIPLRLATLQLAGAQLNLIRAWLAGEEYFEAAALARAICRTSQSLLTGWFPSGIDAR